MPNKEFAILTALLFCVYSEEFNCTGHQQNCFWIRKIPSNWYTAYADCTLSGGSLISSDYFVVSIAICISLFVSKTVFDQIYFNQ